MYNAAFFSRNTRARRQHVIFRCQLGNWLSTSPLSFLFFGTFLIITSERKTTMVPLLEMKVFPVFLTLNDFSVLFAFRKWRSIWTRKRIITSNVFIYCKVEQKNEKNFFYLLFAVLPTHELCSETTFSTLKKILENSTHILKTYSVFWDKPRDLWYVIDVFGLVLFTVAHRNYTLLPSRHFHLRATWVPLHIATGSSFCLSGNISSHKSPAL